MKDPRRLLEDAALSDVERRSLTAARAVEPPPELASEVWTDLVMAVGAAGAASSVARTAASASAKANAATTAGAGAKVAVIKALALGATVGAITTGGAVALTSPPGHAPEASVAPSAGAATARRSSVSRNRERDVVPPAVEPPAESTTPKATGTDTTAGTRPREVAHSSETRSARDEQASPAGTATAVSDGVGTKVPAADDGAETARAEARLVGVAREALQHGDPARALVVLEDAQHRFPDGILLQEREALSISALAAVGRKAEAASRASIFLRAFPNSPHAERVRAALRAY